MLTQTWVREGQGGMSVIRQWWGKAASGHCSDIDGNIRHEPGTCCNGQCCGYADIKVVTGPDSEGLQAEATVCDGEHPYHPETGRPCRLSPGHEDVAHRDDRGNEWWEPDLSAPVVPSVGAVPVEVPEEAVEAALMALVEAQYLPTPVDQFRRAQQIALAGAYPLIAARVRAETIAELSAVEAAEGDPDVAEMRRWANQTPDRYARDAVLAAADAVERAQRIEVELIRRAEAADRADLASIGDALDVSQCRHGHRADTYRAAARVAAGSAVPVVIPPPLTGWFDVSGGPPPAGSRPVATPTEPGDMLAVLDECNCEHGRIPEVCADCDEDEPLADAEVVACPAAARGEPDWAPPADQAGQR